MARVHVLRALARREYAIARSYPTVLVLGLVFGVLNLALYFYLSRTFSSLSTAALDGAPSYFAYACVGVAIATVVQAAIAGLTRRVREEQLTGGLEALVVQPVTAPELALGLVGFPFVLALARVMAYLGTAALLLGLPLEEADPVGVVAVLAIASPAFAGIGIALAAAVLVVRRAEALVSLVVFGLFFCSGAYFPTSELPDWLAQAARVAPTLHACEGLRAALFKGGDWHSAALWLLVWATVSVPLGCLLFSAALARARRRGSIGEA